MAMQVAEIISRKDALARVAKVPAAFRDPITRMLGFAWGGPKDGPVEVLSDETVIKGDYVVKDVTMALGDLTIDGLLEDGFADHSLLIVLGNLHVGRAVLLGQVFVLGNFTVDGNVSCCSYEHYTLDVGGALRAGGYLRLETRVTAKQGIHARHRYETPANGLDQLQPACRGDDTCDDVEINLRVRQGKPVFRSEGGKGNDKVTPAKKQVAKKITPAKRAAPAKRVTPAKRITPAKRVTSRRPSASRQRRSVAKCSVIRG